MWPRWNDAVEWRYLYEERAGILEDSGMPREDAERVAREMVAALWREERRKRP